MEQKISELTDKLYKEGVEKGEQKASQLQQEAEQKRDAIISDAQKEAEQIKERAKKEAQDLRRNMESEIKIAGQQLTSEIKQQITDAITATQVNESISKTLQDPETVREFIRILLENWDPKSAQIPSVAVLLPEEKKQELEKAFKAGVFKKLSESPSIQFSKKIKRGFQIEAKDSGFIISFTDEDFVEFFKMYLRPKTGEFLFGAEQS